jgi:hypothetical protein
MSSGFNNDMRSAPATTPGEPVLVNRDTEHLKLLSIFWYVIAGLNAVGGCFSTIYIVMGAVFLAAPPEMTSPTTRPGQAAQPDVPPEVMGGMFLGIGGCLMIFLLGLAILAFMTARSLGQRRRRTFCMVMAGITCLSVPIGTVLGVFTLMVLARPSVAALFARARPA